MKLLCYMLEGSMESYIPGTGEICKLPVLSRVKMPWSEANEERARREAYNGEYSIEDSEAAEPEL